MGLLNKYSKVSEEEVRSFWVKETIPAKARELNKGEKTFYLMDGPPYASGHIHMGTALNKILKDVSIRMKRMQGFDCLDQPGYDTHGLPIEHKVQAQLGLKTKEDIEAFGVDKFINECRNFATRFIDSMNQEFDNLGVWMDWSNPYITCTNEYIEGLWWTFKKAEEKDLLYLGKYPIHACPSCETAVAFNEIEYTKQTDTSIYVKFELVDEPNTFLIIWTTTPWTLPGNTGVMVNPKYVYVKAVLSNGEKWVVAKELLQELMDSVEAGYTVDSEFLGSELVGKKYVNPLKQFLNIDSNSLNDKAYTVIPSERYVNLDAGTGLVHCAPGHGKEDYDAGVKAGLPILCPVELNGVLTKEAGKYVGKKAREVDSEIINDLKNTNSLVLTHPYTHDYPICWRCKSPLIMISSDQWFFKITSIRDRLLELNQNINWVPRWGKDRFNNWLNQLSDWPVSRARYWGTPLPIWVCDCGEKKIVSSKQELIEVGNNVPKDLDLHKPWIDEVTITCPKCGKEMHRVPEVLDVWFDSGASSWGSLGYPEEKELFEKYWPADFNLEGKDQIRGWWNSQIITGTICFNKSPFKTVFMHGMVLDLGKKKMSKSLGNIITPKEVIEKYNRDYLRMYIAREVSGEDIAFSWKAFEDINKFFNVLWNSINFGVMYLDLELKQNNFNLNELKQEDKWVLSKLNSLKKNVLKNYNEFNYNKVMQLIQEFVLMDLSRTYIKLIRSRTNTDKKVLSKVFSEIIFSLTKLLAPITPHVSEFVYLKTKSKELPESIHLTKFNPVVEELIDKSLEEQFELAKEIIQLSLNLREELKLRLRWPLEELIIVTKTGEELNKVTSLIKTMSNVKKVTESTIEPTSFPFKKLNDNVKVFLNNKATEELKNEWEFMELKRRIQSQRKQLGLKPTDSIQLMLSSDNQEFLNKFRERIEEETNTRIIEGKEPTEQFIQNKYYIELKKE